MKMLFFMQCWKVSILQIHTHLGIILEKRKFSILFIMVALNHTLKNWKTVRKSRRGEL